MTLLDGKTCSEEILKEVQEEISKLEKKLTLALILVGEDPASMVYVRNKNKVCYDLGIETRNYYLEENASQKELLSIINDCNNDSTITAILVQMPLPSHINSFDVLNAIDPKKDVDGLGLVNQGKLFNNRKDVIIPATPLGIMNLLKRYHLPIASRNVVIVGRSQLVGKPAAMLFLNNNATVTIAHSKTEDLKEITRKADILVVAVGKPKYITVDMVKKDAIVIDVGINRVEGKLVGDVDFDNVQDVASFITPVPKGVGPMTVASLMQNILLCYQLSQNNDWGWNKWKCL